MQQQCVSLHTNKDLKETEQIFEKEEMEILLKTNEMFINFSDMTDEEKISWIKLMRDDLDNAVDDMEIFYHKIERFNKKKHTAPEDIRKMLDSLNTSEAIVLDGAHQNLINELSGLENESRHLSFFARYRSRDIESFKNGIRCSCIIARKGTDVVRYLSFLKDPVVTFTGPNASKLKSSLEKKF